MYEHEGLAVLIGSGGRAARVVGTLVTEVIDAAVEEAVSAASGVPIVIPSSPADLVQDAGKAVVKKVMRACLGPMTPGQVALKELVDEATNRGRKPLTREQV